VLRTFLRERGGQSFVELALALPVLVFGLIGGVDLLRVSAIQQAVQNAARVGAEYAGDLTSADSSTDTAIQAAILNELGGTPGLDAPSLTTPCPADAALPASGDPPCASLPSQSSGRYVGALYSGGSCTASSSSGVCYVQVTVRYTFTTLVRWPVVPNQIRVDRTVQWPQVPQ
jgi:hypothetical protein